MEYGMMWFDNDPKKPLDEKVNQAAEYYRHKYGRNPDMCMVNPASLVGAENTTEPLKAGRVFIRALQVVMPGHLWIGVEDGLKPASKTA